MKKSLLIFGIFLGLISCNQNNKFHIKGTIKDAKNEILYFEHAELMKTTVLDSVKLDENGSFSFNADKPKYPDLYDLKLENKVIIFAVDSNETISFETQNQNFATSYKVNGSETSIEIQQLRQSILKIQEELNDLTNKLGADERNVKIQKINTDIEEHKDLAKKLILKNPRSLAAYFAVYQQVNNTYIFSPYVKTDRPFCSAVATAYNVYMPDYERSKNIYSLVMDAIKIDRQKEAEDAMKKASDQSNTGYIDIKLNDKNGKLRKLSELQGKVVLIDFSAYESDNSIDYTFALRDLYNKYHKRGFEIYQVSADRNKLIWEQSIENIPWICVRDENGPNTISVASYNIKSLPTNFLMNKKGVITSRSLSFPELAKQIEKDL
jgi:hypothetical protein